MKRSRSNRLGARACERRAGAGPVGRMVCACRSCGIRRAVAVDRVGHDFPGLGAALVRAMVESA